MIRVLLSRKVCKRLLLIIARHMSGPGLFSRIPTMGGRQFWSDVWIGGGARIQRNVWTGHHRTLDAANRRIVFGSRPVCLTSARKMVSGRQSMARDIRSSRQATLIVFLHGLYQSRKSLQRLENRLACLGWSTMAIGYPSAVASIQDHAGQVNRLLDQTHGYSRIIFVGHSLGGLVARAALADPGGWHARMTVAGLIQLGTPNQGAQLASWLRRRRVIRKFLTTPVRELSTRITLPEPHREIPVMVIAGGGSRGRGYNPWLEGNNDGVVRVEETALTRPIAITWYRRSIHS